MKNQLPKDLGERTPRRACQSTTTYSTRISRQRGDSDVNPVTRSEKNSENGRLFLSQGHCLANGSENGSPCQDGDTVRDKTGNRGGALPKMPLKLLPNFGEDPSRRVRKWNKAVERKFEINMEAMSQELKNKTSKLDRGIRNIEDQLKDLDLDRSYYTSSSVESLNEDDYGDQTSNIKFPQIPNGRKRSSRRQGSGHRCSYNLTRTKRKCHHFPCVRPKTYHTIGYRGNPSFTNWMSWEAIKESWNAPELVDNVSTSAHDVKVSPRMLTLRKEEKLRKEIERRRMMNHTKRPQSWVTNYGQPMSYKQLKYPVRLYPITN